MPDTTTGEQKIDHLCEYVDVEIQILKLRAVEKVAAGTGSVISRAVITSLLFLSVIFASIAAGFYLSDHLQSKATGFLIVGGAYLIITIFFMLFRRPLLINIIRDHIINHILS